MGESSYYYYSLYMKELDYKNLTLDQLKTSLAEIPLKNTTDYFMIIDEKQNKDTIYFSSPDGYVSDFFLLYMKNFSNKTDGRVYEYFGVEEQAYTKTVTIADGSNYTIGFKYSNTSVDTTIYFITIAFLASGMFLVVLIYWSKNISKHIVEVSTTMARMATDQNVDNIKPLPIMSNDEIGELTSSFNEIQKLTNNYIRQIQDSQDTLMERERLASLGQLIGGIAHNLKTPIMSISGAAEGLNDLVKEYDASIGDPEVNNDDHHDIAKDMFGWISKIKTHTEYMSDVITAVKGQAVQLSNEETVTFTIDELLKRVDILMKHELKSALVYLNIQLKTDENISIHGDVNSLVQVINNMISNSIQAYNEKPEQNIDMIVEKENSNLIITITDYAGGIPKSVKDKLFREMVTTKGKNGTGLGLYMSYSTIRAHFGGNITLDSEEGKGTTFKIILPI